MLMGLTDEKGTKCVKLVVECSFFIELVVHEGHHAVFGSSWGEKIITLFFKKKKKSLV
jgi:hypothetical protein